MSSMSDCKQRLLLPQLLIRTFDQAQSSVQAHVWGLLVLFISGYYVLCMWMCATILAVFTKRNGMADSLAHWRSMYLCNRIMELKMCRTCCT